MKVALLITTYNRSDALELVLQTVASQSRVPDQVIICDDGSSPQTERLVRFWAGRLPIVYAWQPDNQFRVARARNLGFSKVDADYCILIDGDCLLPVNFVQRHASLARRGFLVSGGRYLLTPQITASVLAQNKYERSLFKHWKFWDLSLGCLRYIHSTNWDVVRTCNLSLFRDDVLAADGFDEAFVGWGREDSDFVIRLIHRGIKVKSARLAACIAHLYHNERPKGQLSVNDARLQITMDKSNHILPTSSILRSL